MISDQYCLSWSAVDGVREFVTNALDSDNPFEWDYSSNTLVLTTKNFTLDAKYLLMGVSENRGKEESVGRHGEGLVVSMGVLLREGHEVIIYNGSKQWIPKFEHSEDFDANFLAIHEYQDTFKSSDDFTIAIHDINQDMFDQIQDRCLYMQSEESVGKVIATENGRILLERCCNIYVGGIWVSETELEYSYDFNPSKLKLNRDRQSVEGWDEYFDYCNADTEVSDINLNDQKGNINMTTRKTVTVELFDDSKGLDAVDSLVFSEKITTDLAEDNMIIQQILLEGEVAAAIEIHNSFRVDMLDESILASSGNQVNLREVKLKDLRWNVKG